MIKIKICKLCKNNFEGNHNKLFCDMCRIKKEKDGYWNNRDICLLRAKKYRQKIKNNKELQLKKQAYNKNYYLNNLEQIKKNSKLYRVTHNEYFKAYSIKNRKYNNLINLMNNKKRYYNDINFRLSVIFRTRIKAALKNSAKKTKSIDLLGCTIHEFKNHLEKQFSDNMTWQNYGFGPDKWNIDHILPVSKFNLLDINEQHKCFHYTNQQPLWWKDNMKKRDKILVDIKW